MLKNSMIWLGSLAAAFYSLFMLVRTARPVLDAFRLTDSSGMIGLYLSLGGFLANVVIVFLFSVLVWRGVKGKKFLDRIPVPFVFAFALKLLEAPLTPIGFPVISTPLIIILTGRVITGTRDREVRMAGLLLFTVLALAATVTWWRITPKSPVECGYISEISARGNCLNIFAQKNRDIGICRQIDFRSTRYQCIVKIAQETGHPELCEEIQIPPDAKVSNFEAPVSRVKDNCYYRLALDLRSHDVCLKIGDEKKKKSCIEDAASQAGP